MADRVTDGITTTDKIAGETAANLDKMSGSAIDKTAVEDKTSDLTSDESSTDAETTFNKIKDTGKSVFDKWGGKGIIGASAGFAVSALMFKSKSPIMTLAMTGGGFFIERFLTKEKNTEKSNTLAIENNQVDLENITDATNDIEQSAEPLMQKTDTAVDVSAKVSSEFNRYQQKTSMQETDSLECALTKMASELNRYQQDGNISCLDVSPNEISKSSSSDILFE